MSASAHSRYANNSEEVNYLAVLEYGRGEIRPQYTPPAARGDFARAQFTIPGGPYSLVNGQNIFSGISGRHSLAKTTPPNDPLDQEAALQMI